MDHVTQQNAALVAEAAAAAESLKVRASDLAQTVSIFKGDHIPGTADVPYRATPWGLVERLEAA
jgi:methyl-accepting chemotaxis protein